MNHKTKLIILGGLLIGFLSAIPFLGWGFPVYAFLGAMLVSYFYVTKSPVRIQAGDGAIFGLLTGVAGGIASVIIYIGIQLIFLIIGIVIQAVLSKDPGAVGFSAVFSGGFAVIYTIITAFCSLGIVLFSLLGGLLGASIFEKRT